MSGQLKGRQSQRRLASGPVIPHFSKVISWLRAYRGSYLSRQMITSVIDSWWCLEMALATRPILVVMRKVSLSVMASLGISISAWRMVSSTFGVTSSGSSQMGIWQTGGSYSFFFFFPFFFFFLGAITLFSIYYEVALITEHQQEIIINCESQPAWAASDLLPSIRRRSSRRHAWGIPWLRYPTLNVDEALNPV